MLRKVTEVNGILTLASDIQVYTVCGVSEVVSIRDLCGTLYMENYVHSTLAINRHKKESRHGEQTLTHYGICIQWKVYVEVRAPTCKKTGQISLS